MNPWKEILIALGGNATILIVLAFLTRSLVQTWLAKDVKKFETGLQITANSELERLKFELKQGADTSLERLRMGLQEEALEHRVRFSKLHERRAQAIEELYSQLVDTHLAARRYVLGFGCDESARPAASAVIHSKFTDLYSLVEKSRIYVPEHICGQLDAIQDVMHRAVIAVDVYATIRSPVSAELAQQAADKLMAAAEAFEGKIPQARRALENELRKMLGDTNPPQSA